jgi:hypothetical protein
VSNSGTSRRRELSYRYAPVPGWVFDIDTRGELSEQRFRILSHLFKHAQFGPLAERGETPHLSLERLAAAIRWPHEPESLTRELRRIRADGLLGYRVTGNAKTGFRYVFTLYPDGPRASDHRPTKESPSQSQETGVEDALSTDPRLTTSSSRPTIEEPSNPHVERDRELAAQTACPTSTDVSEKSKTVGEGAKEGKASVSRAGAHAREGNGQAETADALTRALAQLALDESKTASLEREQAVLDEIAVQFDAKVRADSRDVPAGGER